MKTLERPTGTLKSKMGTLDYMFTSGTHVAVYTPKIGNDIQYHEIKGKKFQATIHLFLVDGEWRENPEGGDQIYISTKSFSEKLTDTQKGAVREEMIAAWKLNIKNFPFLESKAIAFERYSKKATCMGEVKRIQENIAILQTQLSDMLQQLSDLI